HDAGAVVRCAGSSDRVRSLRGGADETAETTRARGRIAGRGLARAEVSSEAVGLELVAIAPGFDAALDPYAATTGIRADRRVVWETQGDVRRHEVGEEPQRSRAVGQRVENLEVDPATMMH